jgi:hypothetical protein
MKKTISAFAALAVSAIMLTSFDHKTDSVSIKGSVFPADKGAKAWALSFDDTLVAEIKNGSFEIKNVVPGEYQVVIEAKDPFANIRLRDVDIAYNNAAVEDLGEIRLKEKAK